MSFAERGPGRFIPLTPIAPHPCSPLRWMEPVWVPSREPVSPTKEPEHVPTSPTPAPLPEEVPELQPA